MTSPPTVRRGARANQRALQDAIKQMIVTRGLTAGSPLPTEPELVKELGVSRHPLREAMKALEALGIVDIRHGHGTYVGTASLSGFEAGLSFHSELSVNGDPATIRNLLEVRQILETGLMHKVLDTHTRADLSELQESVTEMERRAADGEYAPEADWRFHETLYRRLDNDFVLELIRVFWRVFHSLDARLPRGDGTPRATAAWHRDILEALRARDEPALAAAMEAHFAGIRSRVDG